jgi:histidine phosphotransferase ChpT
MTISPVDFASLLCSRLCHDLLSPVGALNNGLELLADEQDPEMRQRCLELLAESAKASANKLKFFRLAFGAAGGFGEAIDSREARVAIEGLFGDGHRVNLGWLVEDATLPKAAIKVLLNLALIGGDALIRGGQLDVGAEVHDGQVEIVVRADGPRIVLDNELRTTWLEGQQGDAPITARGAAAYLVHELVVAGGGTVQVSDPDDPVLLFGAAFSTGEAALPD